MINLNKSKLPDLNADFFRHAKIPGLVSIIYYPAGFSLGGAGHSELEIEGISYFVACDCKVKNSFEKKIQSAKNGKLPFFQCNISITPDQLLRIKKILASNDHLYGITCMNGVSRVLNQAGVIWIPPIINISPLASHLYLRVAKIFGSNQIAKFNFYGNISNNWKNLFAVPLGVGGEINVWIQACYVINFLSTKLWMVSTT